MANPDISLHGWVCLPCVLVSVCLYECVRVVCGVPSGKVTSIPPNIEPTRFLIYTSKPVDRCCRRWITLWLPRGNPLYITSSHARFEVSGSFRTTETLLFEAASTFTFIWAARPRLSLLSCYCCPCYRPTTRRQRIQPYKVPEYKFDRLSRWDKTRSSLTNCFV